MRQSICRSLLSYFYSKPPLSIFLLSLIMLSATSLILALYCHHNTDLLNLDILNWHSLLSRMPDFKYCLQNSSVTSEGSNNTMFTATMANIPLQLSEVDIVSGSVTLAGNISLAMFGLGHISQDNVTVRIQSTGANQACVRVESVDSHMIKALVNESVGQSACIDNGQPTRVFTAHSSRHVPHVWCSAPGQSVFSLDIAQVPPGLETRLDQDQRDVIYQHLVTASLLLLMLCLTIVTGVGVMVTRDRSRDMTLVPDHDHSDNDM